MNIVEEARATARKHGVVIVDYRRPKKGEEYIYHGDIQRAGVHHDKPQDGPQPIISRSQWHRAPGDFRLGDIVRMTRTWFNPALEGVVGQVVRIDGQIEVLHPLGSDKQQSVYLWPRELELVAGAVMQEDSDDDVDELPEHGRQQYPETAEEAFESDMKPTNPKDAIGSDKLPLHLWPTTATVLGCLGLLDGALKYGRSNWREAGVKWSIYYDAQRRHMDAAFEGEDLDPDSGLPHLAHALACIAIIIDAEATGTLVDDRQYRGDGYRKLVSELTPVVKDLREKHAHRDPKHYTIADGPL